MFSSKQMKATFGDQTVNIAILKIALNKLVIKKPRDIEEGLTHPAGIPYLKKVCLS